MNRTKNFPTQKVSVQLEGLQPISSPDAERAVLGAMLSGQPDPVDQALAALSPEDFFVPAHGVIFSAIRDMREKSQAISEMTVLAYLEDRKLADSVGGVTVLLELGAGVLAVLTATEHIQRVKQKAQLRRLVTACAQTVHDAMERQHEPESVLDGAEKRIYAVTEAASVARGDFRPLRDYVVPLVDQIMAASRRGTAYSGIPTGYDDLDVCMDGLHAGEMVVLAMRPGVGKTALMLSMARKMAARRFNDDGTTATPGYRVGIVSLEMPVTQLLLRWSAMETRISMQDIRSGRMSEHGLGLLDHAMTRMSDWPVWVDETSGQTIREVKSKARKLKRQHDIEVLMIDYLQLMEGDGEDRERHAQVAAMSRGVKALAKELKIPVIVLAQLNRKAEEAKDPRPMLHHLRESGSIEQDADAVILGWRDDQDVRHLHLAKQRNGPLAEFIADWHGTSTEITGIRRVEQ
jgi:replicative DNA helicase